MLSRKVWEITFRYLSDSIPKIHLGQAVERSTFFIPIAIGKRVAKASTGLFPLPFLITLIRL